MNMKKIILLTVILMIAISSLSMVSAGLFDFLGSGKTDTYMLFDTPYSKSENAEYVSVMLLANSTNGTDKKLDNKTIHVNVTDENGTTKSYDVNSSEKEYVKICKLDPGKYTITAIFPGDNEYKPCNLTEHKNISKAVVVDPKQVDVKDSSGNLVNRYYVST